MLPHLVILSIIFIAVCDGKVIASSMGSEFVFAFLGQNDDRRQVIVINTLQNSPAINVSLTIPTLSISETFTVTNSLPQISRWPNRTDICYQPVIVKADGEIFVYAMTSSGLGVADSFTALPTSSLGTKYHVLQYRPLCSTAELIVISLGDGDTKITLSNLSVGFHRETSHTLGPYEAYTKKASGIIDWTGATVTSDKPVAVISAVSCVIVPNDGDTFAADGCGLLVEMLPDDRSYGYHFVLTTFFPRQSGFLYRVLASQNGTKFTVTSSNYIFSKSLDDGDFYEGNEEKQFEMLIIRSSKPVAVVQYTKSKNPPYGMSDGMSEPFMILIPPVSHYSDDLVFTSIGTDGATKVSITSLCDHHNALLVDGVPIEDRQQLMKFMSEDMCVSHFDMGEGLQQHSIRHPTSRPFLALAYGTGPRTAFGYPVKYNVHFSKAPPMEKGMLTEAGKNSLIATSSIVGFILMIMLFCCVEWIRYTRRRRREKPWYDIYHTTVRRRPVYEMHSSITDIGEDADGELLSSSHDNELSPHTPSHSGKLTSLNHNKKLLTRSQDGALSSQRIGQELLLHTPCNKLLSRKHDQELSTKSHDRELSTRRYDGGLSTRSHDGELSTRSCDDELSARPSGELSSQSEEFHSMVDIRVHNINKNASVSHGDRELKRDNICSGDFEIVGASNDGRTIRGILKIVSNNIACSSNAQSQTSVHIRLPPISIESACKTNSLDSQSDIVSVKSQSIQPGDSLSSLLLSSSAESNDSLMSVEEVKSESSDLRCEDEIKDDSEISSVVTDVDDDILKDAVEIASFTTSSGSTVPSETSLQAVKIPTALQELVTSGSSLSSEGESIITSSSTSGSSVSTSTIQSESVEDILSAKQLVMDDLSSASSTVEMSEIESSSTLTDTSDFSLSIGDYQVYKLQYYNMWKML